jgi:hypothetical protein
MGKLNTKHITPQAYSPIRTDAQPTGRTYEGAPGYAMDTRGELFTLGVSLMAGEKTFYESADARNARFISLVHETTKWHPMWTADFLHWLRTEANIRTASIIGGAEFVRAWGELRCDPDCDNPVNYWSASGDGWACGLHRTTGMVMVRPRTVVDSVLQRADETKEITAYWLENYGRAMPMPLKRGIADAVIRMGTERNAIKYASGEGAIALSDVINLTHPGDRRASAQHLRGEWQGDLFGYLTKLPYEPGIEIPASLGMLTRRQALMAVPVAQRRAAVNTEALDAAGITWEALAGWLQGPMTAKEWEAVIPVMGYMARLRNLRNFDEAGVSDAVAQGLCAQLADPTAVAASRQFPYRFLSAYRAAPSDRWAHALGRALDTAVHNIPALDGRTLILCDTSSSMRYPLSDKSVLQRVDAAALFAVALAHRCGFGNVDLIGYATGHFHHSLQLGGSVLKQCERFTARIGEVGMGTNTWHAVRNTFVDPYRVGGHNRVIIFTDEQCHDAPENAVPGHVPVYTFNLGGYRLSGHGLSGQSNRHTLAGLTDATFRQIPLLESGRNGAWPWLARRADQPE